MAPTQYPARPGRVDVVLPVYVQIRDAAFGGVVRNLGIGGTFVAADHTGRLGDLLLLLFSLPGHAENISMWGEVRWVRTDFASEGGAPTGMGIRFLGLAIANTLVLTRLVNQAAEAASRGRNGA